MKISDGMQKKDCVGLGQAGAPCGSRRYRVGKRAMDISRASVLLPLVLPVCLLVMLFIWCTSCGPLFYRHRRIGQNGRAFYMYKFRTMVPDGEEVLRSHFVRDPEAEAEWRQQNKLRFDPRVTPIGRILRRASLDELPQFLNVVLGDMSFVGPRPIVAEEIHRYGDAFHLYALAKPGITGLWQISGRGTLPYEVRVLLDIEYLRKWSLLYDLRILVETSRAVTSAEGAF
jgi:exopolysaccharide production protein ExoY